MSAQQWDSLATSFYGNVVPVPQPVQQAYSAHSWPEPDLSYLERATSGA